MSTFELNIKDNVTVTLTPEGVKYLYKHYETLHSEKLITYHYKTKNVYKFQVWELMNIFGKHMYMGATQCFKDNKIIKEAKGEKGVEIQK